MTKSLDEVFFKFEVEDGSTWLERRQFRNGYTHIRRAYVYDPEELKTTYIEAGSEVSDLQVDQAGFRYFEEKLDHPVQQYQTHFLWVKACNIRHASGNRRHIVCYWCSNPIVDPRELTVTTTKRTQQLLAGHGMFCHATCKELWTPTQEQIDKGLKTGWEKLKNFQQKSKLP